MNLPQIIENHYQELVSCCQDHQVKQLFVFGSVLGNNFDPNLSDLDFLVVLNPMSPLEKGKTLLSFWAALEFLFSKKVDLLTDKPIKNPFLKKQIDHTKQLIYDGQGQEIFV